MFLKLRPVVLDQFVRVKCVRTDLAAPRYLLLLLVQDGHLLFLFLLFKLIKPRLEDSHSDRPVLMLRPFVLALHNDARRNVGNTNSRLRPVHMLAAGTTRPEGIYPEVLLFD